MNQPKRGRPAKRPPISAPTNVSRAVRKERIPLGAPRMKMSVKEQNPNMKMRWVNDSGGRIANAQEGGYRFVEHDVTIGSTDVVDGNTDTGSRISKVVGSQEDGSPLRAYLMQIDRETYEEDQALKESEIQKTEAAIRSGNPDGKAGDNRYIPSEGIRLRS